LGELSGSLRDSAKVISEELPVTVGTIELLRLAQVGIVVHYGRTHGYTPDRSFEGMNI
jgi:hypothetical protein